MEAVLERLLGAWADLAPGQLAAGEPEEPAVRGLAAVLACAALLLDRLPPAALYATPGAPVPALHIRCMRCCCMLCRAIGCPRLLLPDFVAMTLLRWCEQYPYMHQPLLCRAAGGKGGIIAVRMHAATNAGFGRTFNAEAQCCIAGRPEGWAAALLRACAPFVPAAAPAVRPPPALQAALVQLNMAAAALLARFLPTAAMGAGQVRSSNAGRFLGAQCLTLQTRFLPIKALCHGGVTAAVGSWLAVLLACPGMSVPQQLKGRCMLVACFRNVRLLQALQCLQQQRCPAAGTRC